MTETLIFELSVILVTTALFCTITAIGRQPLMIAYIFAGIILGKQGLNIITEAEFFHTLSDIGILLLLYLIGVELKPKRFMSKLHTNLLIATLTGALTTAFTFIVAPMFQLSLIETIYLTIALFFSSTVVVMHRLIDKHKPTSKVFETCVGVLLVQDIIAVITLIVLNSGETSINGFDLTTLGQFILHGLLIVALAWSLQRWLLRITLRKIQMKGDLVFLLGLAWCFFFAELAEQLNLSREIGAFIAGLSITSLPDHKQEVFVTKSETIRDFFMILFFFMLGANFEFDQWENTWPLIASAVGLGVIIKPLSLMWFSRLTGIGKKSSTEIGMRMGQISEFSIIVTALGLKVGQITNEFAQLISLILFITIIISGYTVQYIMPWKLKRKKLTTNFRPFSYPCYLSSCLSS